MDKSRESDEASQCHGCWFVGVAAMVAMSVLCFPYSVIVFAYGSGSSRLSPRNPRVVQALNARQLGTLQFDLLSEAEATERANVPVRGAVRAGAGGRRCWRLIPGASCCHALKRLCRYYPPWSLTTFDQTLVRLIRIKASEWVRNKLQ